MKVSLTSKFEKCYGCPLRECSIRELRDEQSLCTQPSGKQSPSSAPRVICPLCLQQLQSPGSGFVCPRTLCLGLVFHHSLTPPQCHIVLSHLSPPQYSILSVKLQPLCYFFCPWPSVSPTWRRLSCYIQLLLEHLDHPLYPPFLSWAPKGDKNGLGDWSWMGSECRISNN